LRHASVIFAQTLHDDLRTWSANEYVSSFGKVFEISKTRIAASIAR